MKIIKLTLILLFVAAQACLAQWSPGSGQITTNDKIGIGNPLPTSSLTIGSPINRGTAELVGSSSFPPGFNFTDSRSGGRSYTFYSGLSGLGNFDIFDQAAGAFRFIITSEGKIGMGTLSPQATLDVARTTLAGPILRLTTPYDTGQALNFSVTQTSSNNGYYALDLGNNLAGWQKLVIPTGNVGIGTTQPDQKLTVNGTIHSKEVKVDASIPPPDYVFEPTYKLINLTELKYYLDANHHLPEIPSAIEVEKNGLNLSEMNLKLLKKVEELTLYAIEQQKRIENLEQSQAERKILEARIAALEKALLKLSR